MYTQYFGFKEIPFSIAPNPHFLYMSERHKEALAHLSYGLGETGGFVLLTGEVGTGKTTVSRCLLEQLGEDTQVAFILNPALSAFELLATICDELKIRYRKTGATLKTLTDKISQKLLKNHENQINTILIIDEAQHLQAEVLEQLRLLTNLETHTKKLMQVILIGQPELQQLLQRQDLRQLAQRITARYHLLPLTKAEVGHYIEHRLAVVGCQQKLFTDSAISSIHRLSNGIPRLINLLCDRALLGAYAQGKQLVDKKMVNIAAREALGAERQVKPWWQHNAFRIIIFVMVLIAMVVIGAQLGQQAIENPVVTNSTQQGQGTAQTVTVDSNSNRDLSKAAIKLFAAWRVILDENITEPCQVSQTYLLACHWFKGNVTALKRMGYPAVMQFVDQQGRVFYGNLIGVQSDQLLIEFAKGKQAVTNSWLAQNWQGGALIFWQAPSLNGEFVEQIDASSDLMLIQWLEDNLAIKQQRPKRMIESFDQLLVNQLQQFQQSQGIVVSSFANVQTVMYLANQSALGMPVFINQ
ncbi:AAA family ATPase [Thalassotalea sp. LPB0316]|uniref:ExeA family protein n=1 Tax=Thalassotalea sp. LPB0316 TaxID=2769490 RepID=UPI001868BF36|nr:AAA family ATPase [Thalassotalea sp. LPB0316]QOL26909.1 AAA family ATPase [Thalassotalea sp. LPB0316]